MNIDAASRRCGELYGRGRNVRRPRPLWLLVLALLCFTSADNVLAQQRDTTARRDTIKDELTAGESDAEMKPRSLLKALQHDFGFMTMYLGGGVLFDGVSYSQNRESLEQMDDLRDEMLLRDARILTGGRFNTDRAITWQAGVMYDAVDKKWLVRQSGLMIHVPEISSHFFVGRAKEGVSMNKVMVGYDGWSMERLPFTDATIPLLADGIKWLGSVNDNHVFWNLGWFTDVLSEGQGFSSYNWTVALRTGWVPLVPDSTNPTLLHMAVNLRTGDPDKAALRLKSKPESFGSPLFIDTGSMPADWGHLVGLETYYEHHQALLGIEYYLQIVDSPEFGLRKFHGGEFALAWLVTGETRSYNRVGHYFRPISPAHTVFQGGPGAWEVVFKFSYSNLRDGAVNGGTFWRVTPMLNWHLTDVMRLELAYGDGTLDRFGLRGNTRFFQTRLQIKL